MVYAIRRAHKLTYSKHSFIFKSTNKLVTLKYNKAKNQVLFKGKWINGADIYKLGFNDANLSKKCVDCNKDLIDYSWECSACETKKKKALNEIVSETYNFLGANLK